MKKDRFEITLRAQIRRSMKKLNYYRRRNRADKTPLDYCDSDWSSWFEWEGHVSALEWALETYLKGRKK